MKLAPVIVFAFNRPDTLADTLTTLKQNTLADKTDLYVFVDGPRNEDDKIKISKVKNILDNLHGFQSQTITYSNTNKGLAQSIISGTTEIINKYGKVIVVEDDLYLSKSFLTFMNQALDIYQSDQRIFQISGFGVKITPPKDYQADVYLHNRAQSWTWGTWKDRWETIDWQVSDYKELCKDKKKQQAFNTGGSDLFGMLKGFMEGKNNSWYIRFTYSMFQQGKFGITPIISLVKNEGFRADSTHCDSYNRYKIKFLSGVKTNFVLPQNLQFDKRLSKQAYKYWGIPYRIYGKVRTYMIKTKRFFLQKL